MNKFIREQNDVKESVQTSRVASLILEYLEMSSKPIKMRELVKKQDFR